MKNHSGPLPALVGGIVIVAVLATILVQDGWMIWIPVLLALAVVSRFGASMNRR